MSVLRLKPGFVPLVDAAPLIVAEVLGFAADEGLELALTPAPSWSTLRDMLALGQVEAARMLALLPVASALGLGESAARLGRVRQNACPCEGGGGYRFCRPTRVKTKGWIGAGDSATA